MAADRPKLPDAATLAVHAGAAAAEPQQPVVQPIYQTATFFSDAVPAGEVRYTRHGTNPNHATLAAKLAALEGAEAALVTASGNAAVALTLLSLARAGDHIIAQRQLYGGTLRLLQRELPRLDIETSFIDTDGDWAAGFNSRTRLVLLEIPANPTLRVADLAGIVALAARREVPVVVDATFATPLNLRPIEHGAALVVHSATKYLAGHSDVTAGVVAGAATRVEAIRQKLISFGPVLDPHAAWLVERGVKTLAARMACHNANGIEVARWLAAHPRVEMVHYPGLATHPDHERAVALLSGFGGMVGMVVRGGDAAAVRMLGRLRLISVAPSLGGVESLASMPRHTSHVALDDAARSELGIAAGFVRLSLGIESAADLIADLEAALDA